MDHDGKTSRYSPIDYINIKADDLSWRPCAANAGLLNNSNLELSVDLIPSTILTELLLNRLDFDTPLYNVFQGGQPWLVLYRKDGTICCTTGVS